MAEKVDYGLTEAEAALLDAATEGATAAAGAAGGGIGGAIGGGIGAGGAGDVKSGDIAAPVAQKAVDLPSRNAVLAHDLAVVVDPVGEGRQRA
jgi:hypothetical protein